ncbi:hypothetical protein ACFV2N_16765 [Streptomyces sp. NPDC059680]|uniref:hypothetical protein n=1 Tax=Streptomyces sp. NPDC059680 TaxID=3346904 RepID=UPI00367B41E6
MINKEAAGIAAATIRTTLAQPTTDAVRTRLATVTDMLGKQFPKVKEMLLEAKDDLTAFAALPERHGKKIQPSHPASGSASRLRCCVGARETPALGGCGCPEPAWMPYSPFRRLG